MAFAPVSPFTLNGLNKFLPMTYHQAIIWAVYAFAELDIADQLIHASYDHGYTVEEIIGEDRKQWNKHFVLTESGVMMTLDHLSHTRDHVLCISAPVIGGACQQLPDIARGEGTGSGVARIFGGLE